MATALIQFNAVTAGQSVLSLSSTTSVTLTDAGGPGATSYQWEFLQVPGPYNTFPTITNDTSQVATVAPPGGEFTDGLYVVRLTRTDVDDGVTVDTKFFGIPDSDGLHLPVAGVNSNMTNVGGSAAAQASGWFGSAIGGTNTMLDSYLRLRRDREITTEGPTQYALIQKRDTVNWPRSIATDTPFGDVVVPGGTGWLYSEELGGAFGFADENDRYYTRTPTDASFSYVWFLYESSQDRHLLFTQSNDGFPNSFVYAQEVTAISESGPTLGGSTQLADGGNNLWGLYTAEAGGGYVYVVGSSSGGTNLIKYDPTTFTDLFSTPVNSETTKVVVHEDAGLYGDSDPRIFTVFDGNGVGRYVDDAPGNLTQEVAPLTPPPGGTWNSFVVGWSIGTGGAVYTALRLSGTQRYHIVRSTLEPLFTGLTYTAEWPQVDGTDSPGDVVFDPSLGKGAVIYTRGSTDVSYVTFFEDTGAAINILSTVQLDDTLYGQAVAGSLSSGNRKPHGSLFNGKAYFVTNGSVDMVADYPADKRYAVAVADLDAETVSPLGPLEYPAFDSLAEGDLAWTQDELNVTRLQDLDLNLTDLGPAPEDGFVYRKSGTEWVGGYPIHARTDSTTFFGQFTMASDLDAYYVNLTSGTGAKPIAFTEKSASGQNSAFRAYDLHFGDFGGGAGSLDRQLELTPQNSRLIHGFDPTGGLATLRLQSAWEKMSVTWNSRNSRWEVSNRYRPWESLNFTSATANSQLLGGKLLVSYSSSTGSGTRTFILPVSPVHGDKVIIYDADGNTAANPFQVRGGTRTIQGVAGATDILFNHDNASVKLLYDSVQDTWVIESRTYP